MFYDYVCQGSNYTRTLGIHAMKQIVLVFLLIFSTGCCAFAQKSRAREVVSQALQKHTSGKILSSYQLTAEFQKQRISKEFFVTDPLMMFFDSLMKTLPDSEKIEALEAKKHMFEDLDDLQAGIKTTYYVAVTSGNVAQIVAMPNTLRGKVDSTKHVYLSGNDLLQEESHLLNPIAMLQRMSKDTTDLHYTGVVTADGIDCLLVQALVHGKWVDVYFDQKTLLMNRLVFRLVDEDPLIGKGPRPYKMIYIFKDYRKKDGFFLPHFIEKNQTDSPFLQDMSLQWEGLNIEFPASIFYKEPEQRKKDTYSIHKIDDVLSVIERHNHYINSRSLIRVDENGSITVFGEFSNIIEDNQDLLGNIKIKFAVNPIKDIYKIGTMAGFTSFSPFFSEQVRVTAPKSSGMFSEEKFILGAEEDSVRKAARANGLLNTFDQEFHNESVAALILNPDRKQEYDNIWVAYYLPKEKVIYTYGNPYSASNSTKKAIPLEKLLYDMIRDRSLDVRKIVYSESYIDDAPLFMTYEDFEKRIKETDFSVYDRKGKR